LRGDEDVTGVKGRACCFEGEMPGTSECRRAREYLPLLREGGDSIIMSESALTRVEVVEEAVLDFLLGLC